MQKTIAPAWTARGRPPAGYWTKRTAEAWLRRLLVEAAAGTLPGMVRTGATVADACAEYLRYIDEDRQRKPWTLRDYDSIFRNHVLPHLDDIALEDTVFHGCMERARKLHRLPFNPVADVEKPRTASRTDGQGWLL